MGKGDPDGRRRAIVDAAVELLAEGGSSRLTHRAIAARAEVPLGSATYYFPTLKDLVRSCLGVVVQRGESQLEIWAIRLSAGDDIAEAVAEMVEDCLAGRHRATMEYEMYLAAARDEELRVPADVWISGLRGVPQQYLGRDEAAAAAQLIDGAVLQSLAMGGPPDLGALRAGVAARVVRSGQGAAPGMGSHDGEKAGSLTEPQKARELAPDSRRSPTRQGTSR